MQAAAAVASKLYGACVLERLPVVAPESPAWEQEYLEWQAVSLLGVHFCEPIRLVRFCVSLLLDQQQAAVNVPVATSSPLSAAVADMLHALSDQSFHHGMHAVVSAAALPA